MDIKVYKTGNKRFPWRAEDAEGHSIDAVTKDAAINCLKNMYHILPTAQNNQHFDIPSEVSF